LEDLGYTASDAKNIINSVFDFAEDNGFFSPYLDSLAKIDSYMETLPEKMESILKNANDVAAWRGRAD